MMWEVSCQIFIHESVSKVGIEVNLHCMTQYDLNVVLTNISHM